MQYFERSLPERQGVDSISLMRFFRRAREEEFHIHSFLALRHGKVIAECYCYPFEPEDGCLVYSVSKTFTALAVGLAQEEGLLTVEDRVLDYFPEYDTEALSPNWKDVTVKNLLCMASGHEKDTIEAVCNSENWLDTFFAQPLEGERGKLFVYNSGGSFVLSEIVSRVTGMPMDEYLRPRLFEPLHITEVSWDRKGNTAMGGWGLMIRPEDLSKLGVLFLQKGKFEGKQIISESWIEAASRRQVETGAGSSDPDWRAGYGYQMWMNEKEGFRADGALGQYCLMYPKKDMIVVITSENMRTQKILTAVWENIVSQAYDGELSMDTDVCGRLKNMLAEEEKPWRFQASWSYMEEKISGKRWMLKKQDGSDEMEVCLRFQGGRLYVEAGGAQEIVSSSVCGQNGETVCLVSPPSLSPIVGKVQSARKWKYTAHHTWANDRILLVTIWYRETGHTQQWEFCFQEEHVKLTIRNGCERLLAPTGAVSDRNMDFASEVYQD